MTNFDVIESYADDFTKWRIENTGVTSTQKKIVIAAGTGTIHLVIKDKQYDVVSGQIQTYSVDGDVTLEFLNMEDVTNFAGTIKFSNIL